MRVKGMIRLCGAVCLALALPACGGHARAADRDMFFQPLSGTSVVEAFPDPPRTVKRGAMPKIRPGTYACSGNSGGLKISAPDASGKVAVGIGTVESPARTCASLTAPALPGATG